MSMEDLKSLLYSLSIVETEFDVRGAGVRVQYYGDDTIYNEWIPARARILGEGLLDPGFGSGPVLYTRLDRVEVCLDDWSAEYGDKGCQAFSGLKAMLPSDSSLNLGDGAIGWIRG